jgi:hypothetical protein
MHKHGTEVIQKQPSAINPYMISGKSGHLISHIQIMVNFKDVFKFLNFTDINFKDRCHVHRTCRKNSDVILTRKFNKIMICPPLNFIPGGNTAVSEQNFIPE